MSKSDAPPLTRKKRLALTFVAFVLVGTGFNIVYMQAGSPSTTPWIVASGVMFVIALGFAVAFIRISND